LAACGPSNVTPVDTLPHKPPTAEEIMVLVSDTDQQICGLNISGLDEGYLLEESLIGTFVDYLAYARDTQASYGEPLRQVYRRAALSRRFQAGTASDGGQDDVAKLANDLYAQLDDGLPSPQSLTEHIEKTRFWDDQIAELNKLRGTEQAERATFNVHFCVVNERGGAARAAARAYLVDNVGETVDVVDQPVFDFIISQDFFTGAFKRELLKGLATPEALAQDELARLALLRDSETALLPTDPKTAEAFWAARDMEIEAGLHYLETTQFETPAEELFAMTRLDQSLRHLIAVFRADNTHFMSEAEADWAFQGEGKGDPAGVFKRLIHVDEGNTKRVQEMLEGREWFQDDLDGEGAGANGWLLVQHADRNPEFQVEVLEMMEAKLGAPGVSKTNFAYLYDRVAVAAGRPQRYGTQGIACVERAYDPGPLEDADNIDILREDLGMQPLAEYMAILGKCDF